MPDRSEDGQVTQRPRQSLRKGLASASHLFALSGFAVAQPLFDLLGRQAEFFIAHDVQPIDLILMTLALSLALPLTLALLVRFTAWLGTAISLGCSTAATVSRFSRSSTRRAA